MILWVCLFLLCSVVLFHLREGYYIDSNTTAAISSLKSITPTLSSLQTTLQGLEAVSLDAADTIRSLNSILGSSDSGLDTTGVITTIRKQKNEVNVFQDNLMATSTALKQIKEIKATIRIGQESKTVTLAEVIPLLQTQINELTDQLRKIPDS